MASKIVNKSGSKAEYQTFVKVHPINVGQGDAILLEVKYKKGKNAKSKKYLIDGGQGQLKKTARGVNPYGNLIATLKKNKCLSTENGKPLCLNLDGIVVTHPDKDHYEGINVLLRSVGSEEDKKNYDPVTVRCPIICTTATRLCGYCRRKDQYNKAILKKGRAYESKKKECPQFWFQKDSPGRIYSKPLDKETQTKISKVPVSNATSILTTVKLPKSKFDYDVVLTGDSYSHLITEALSLRKKHVGIFQVPHHGSSCSYRKDNKRASAEEIAGFYSSFTADTYLISHGVHKGFKHPHHEVITGIIKAAMENNLKQPCKIVVTATGFNKSKIKKISDWGEYVKIYHFKSAKTPFITLDPNQVTWDTIPEGLKQYTMKEKATKNQSCKCSQQVTKKKNGNQDNSSSIAKPSGTFSASNKDKCWVLELDLKMGDKKILESKKDCLDSWLIHKHINAAHSLLKKKYPKVQGLQNVTVASQGRHLNEMKGTGVQIIHRGGNHWACLSTFSCQPTCTHLIHYYDSLFKKADSSVVKSAKELLGCQFDPQVVYKSIQRQSNKSDCGLYAIATATSLCYGKDPCDIRWDQSKMRQHLIQCLEKKKLSPFPRIRKKPDKKMVVAAKKARTTSKKRKPGSVKQSKEVAKRRKKT